MTNPTLPTFRDPQVLAFKEAFGLASPHKFVAFKDTGMNYEPDFCHVSAKVHAMANGGKRVHGWSCWLYPQGLIAEFHSVWRDKKGNLVDVTPPKFGSDRVLFVPDLDARIEAFNDHVSDVFIKPVNRMAPPHHPYWHFGVDHDRADWFYPATNHSFTAYCATHNFSPNDYPTDAYWG